MTLARRIRAARLRAGLSQSEAAGKSDITTAHWSRIERGVRVPNAHTLARIAGGLGCRTDDLLPPEKARKR